MRVLSAQIRGKFFKIFVRQYDGQDAAKSTGRIG
jgi:hypothetical protein